MKVGACDPILHKKVAIPYAWLLRLWAQGRGQDPAGRPLLAPDGRLMLTWGFGPLGRVLAPLATFGAVAGGTQASDDPRASAEFRRHESKFEDPRYWGVEGDRASPLGKVVAEMPSLNHPWAPFHQKLFDAAPDVPRAGGDTLRNKVKAFVSNPWGKTVGQSLQTMATGGAAYLLSGAGETFSTALKSLGWVSFGLAFSLSTLQVTDHMMEGAKGTLTNVECFRRLADQVWAGGHAGFRKLAPLGCKGHTGLFANGEQQKFLRDLNGHIQDLDSATTKSVSEKAQNMQIALEGIVLNKPSNNALVEAMLGLEGGGAGAWEKLYTELEEIQRRGGSVQVEIANAAEDAQAKELSKQLSGFLGDFYHVLAQKLDQNPLTKAWRSVSYGAGNAVKNHSTLTGACIFTSVSLLGTIGYILWVRGHGAAADSRNLLLVDAETAQLEAKKTVALVERTADSILRRRKEFARSRSPTSTVVDEYHDVCLKDSDSTDLLYNLTKLFVQIESAGMYSNLGEMVRDQAKDGWKATVNRALRGDKFEELFREQAAGLRGKVEAIMGSKHRTFADFWGAVGFDLPSAGMVQEAAVYCQDLQDQIQRDSITLSRLRGHVESMQDEARRDEYSMDAEGVAQTERILSSHTPQSLMMMTDEELEQLHANANRLLESILWGYGALGIQNLILTVNYDRNVQDVRAHLESMGTGRDSEHLRKAVDMTIRATDLINNISVQLEDYEHDVHAGPVVRGKPVGVRVPKQPQQ